MNSDLCTLAALALVLVFGWLLDHRDLWDRARKRLRRGMRAGRKTAAIGAAPLR